MKARMREEGQAMVELITMVGMLTLLFLGIWYLGKFHDIQASAIQAARYSAWERTVHSVSELSDADLERQTRARFFTHNQNAFLATDSKSNGEAWGRQSAHWQDHEGDERLVERPDDVRVRTSESATPGVAAGTASRALGAITGAGAAMTGGERLPMGGLYTSTVTVDVADLDDMPAPLDEMDLRLTERHVLLTDSWDASGPRQVARRVRPFTPAAFLANLDPILAPMRVGLSILEPRFILFRPGQICPDIVPNDRVEGRSNLPAYRGAGPCF